MEVETITEMAARLGVSRETIRRWRARHPDFPSGSLRGGVVIDVLEFKVEEIEEWRKRHRLPNRLMQKSQQARRQIGA